MGNITKAVLLNAWVISAMGCVVYTVQGNEKWFSRFVLALVALAAYTVVDVLQKIKSILETKEIR